MSINDFPMYQGVAVKLSLVKDVNSNERKLITQRLRNTENRFQKIYTINLFDQDEMFEELKPFVRIENGGTLPNDQKEDFSNNPNCQFKHSTIMIYQFPQLAYAKTKNGEFLTNSNNQRAVMDHIAVLGMVDRIENDCPIWNASFDPYVEGAKQFRTRFVPIEANHETEEEAAMPPMDSTIPGGNSQAVINPNPNQQNLGGQNPPQGGNGNGYQPQQGNGGQQRANF